MLTEADVLYVGTGREGPSWDASTPEFRRPAAPRKRRVGLRSLSSTLLTLLVLGACIPLIVPVLGLAFGYRTLLVAGGSMAPVAEAGDALVLRRADVAAIAPGEVITFRPLRSSRLVTHRVLRTAEIEGSTYFQTKGDANSSADPDLVPAGNIVGSVALVVPRIGGYYAFAMTVVGRVVLVVLPALWIIWRELRALVPPRRPSERRRRLTGRLVSVGVTVALVLGLSAPALGLFAAATPVPSNTFATGRVDAPSLNSAQADLLLCRITLNWTPPSTGLSPDGYDIYRATVNGGPYSFVNHVGPVGSMTDTGLARNRTYYYVLQSTREQWTSPNSNQRSATTGLLCL